MVHEDSHALYIFVSSINNNVGGYIKREILYECFACLLLLNVNFEFLEFDFEFLQT